MKGGKRIIQNNILAVSLVLFLLISSQGATASVKGPSEQVKESIDSILALFADKELSSQEKRVERRNQIFTVVDKRFDFQRMAMLSLGQHWETHSADEQERFVSLYARLIMQRYIGRIESYSGEVVSYNKELIKGDKARVYTAIVKPASEIPIIYSLQKNGENWLIYDVVVEGVSLVRNYRSEFDTILQRNDFAFLLKKVEEKTIAMQQEDDGK